MKRLVGKLARAERGASAVEYGLIVGITCLLALGGLTSINGRYSSLWGNLADRIPSQS